MNLDTGAVQRDGFDLDPHHLRLLQFLEDSVHDARLRPAIHPGVDGVPIAEPFGQPTPFAAVLCDIQDRIQHVQIGKADIASLRGQAVLDLSELRQRDLHAWIFSQPDRSRRVVLTRPSRHW